MSDVTRILSAIQRGEAGAYDELLSVVYQELRRMAAAQLSQEKPGQTLQPTALVHEVYLRLWNAADGQQWSSRAHFFGAVAEAMRRIIIDDARRKRRLKRGGQMQRIDLDSASPLSDPASLDLLALDEALN